MLGVAAYFQASGVSHLLATALLPPSKALAPSTTVIPTSAAPPSDHATSARSILDRNPFDSVTRRPLDAVWVAGDSTASSAIGLDHSENAPPCEALKALIVLAAPDPTWSMVALSVSSAPTILVRIGQEVAGKRVRIIEWNRAVLTAGPSVCQVRMFQPIKMANASPSALPAATVGSAGTSTGAKSVPIEIASKIRKVGATEFDVDRRVVDEILENQAALMGLVRIVPEQKDGNVVGIRLLNIRPDSLLGVLGLENGDRLQSINGLEMTDPQKALEAYTRLRTADHLTVLVNRRGQNVNIDYSIQ